MDRRVAAVGDLERRIGHQFQDRELLERALTHASVGDGAKKVRDNEVLEFIGDRVLGLLAAEALARLEDLSVLGVTIQADGDGNRRLHPGCFAQDLRCAAQITDLPRTYRLLRGRIEALGGEFLAGHLALSILCTQDNEACGALLAPIRGGPLVPIGSKTVIAALGGPATLFTHHLCEPGAPGIAYGLLAETGARLTNEGFVQFLWSRLGSKEFVRLARLAEKGAAIIDQNQTRVPLPRKLKDLAAERATHCPISWGRDDTTLDLFTLDHADSEGIVTLELPGEQPFRATPMAHCGNGGAIIDRHGATSVPGLFAAGECATGMHGANRIGGAMVAATQVFGARAGREAMRQARIRERPPGILFTDLMKTPFQTLCTANQSDLEQRPLLTSNSISAMLRYKTQHTTIKIENIFSADAKSSPSVLRMSTLSALTVARSLHKIT